jgi:drug/metabolite transporter (DMT)-like permease
MLQALAAMAMVGGAVTASGFLTGYPTFSAQAVRYSAAALLLYACARLIGWGDLRRPIGREWWWLTASATAGLSGYNLAVLRAIEHAEPALVGSFVAGVPLVLALAAPIASGRRVPFGVVAAALVVVLGALIIQGGGRGDATAVGFSLAALAGEAAFTLLAVPVLGRLGALSVATHTSWIAAVQFLVLAVVLDRGDTFVRPSLAVVMAVAFLVVASSGAFVLWFLAVDSIGGAVAGLAGGIIPIVAALSGLALGLTTVDAGVALGTILVAAGVALGLESARRAVPNAVDSRSTTADRPPRSPHRSPRAPQRAAEDRRIRVEVTERVRSSPGYRSRGAGPESRRRRSLVRLNRR